MTDETTATEDAKDLLKEVLAELMSAEPNIKLALRKCQHVCQLLGWDEARMWFQRELSGYPTGATIPPHRKIRGTSRWLPKGGVFDVYRGVVEQVVHGPTDELPEESAETELFANLDWIVSVSQTGFSEPTGEVKPSYSRTQRKEVPFERVRMFDAPSVKGVVAAIERMSFDWASNALARTGYGQAIDSLWAGYRRSIDQRFSSVDVASILNLPEHMTAIEQGLKGQTEECWRASALACRNLLHDVARYLWQDPRPTYDHLPGKGAGGNLGVTDQDSLNRLSAYLHQKGMHGGRGQFLRAQNEYLDAGLRRLYAIQSAAKSELAEDDARSIAIWTYMVIGELAVRTDLEPVTSYN